MSYDVRVDFVSINQNDAQITRAGYDLKAMLVFTIQKVSQREKTKTEMHTRETAATKSYIKIPASARARLAHDTMTGSSPAEMKYRIKKEKEGNPF